MTRGGFGERLIPYKRREFDARKTKSEFEYEAKRLKASCIVD
jgi:hypothetical protein